MKALGVGLLLIVVMAGFSVSFAFVAGVAVSVSSGVSDALNQSDAAKWYMEGKAQIHEYIPGPACHPDLYDGMSCAWGDDRLSEALKPVYEAGLQAGVPAWNEAMSNGLVRIASPLILTIIITAVVTKMVNQALS